MKKVYYLQKKDFKENFKNIKVISDNKRICILNGIPLTSKSFLFKSLEEFKNFEIFKDMDAMGGIIYFLKLSSKEYAKGLNLFLSQISKEKEFFSVNNVEEADEIIVRLYLPNTDEQKEPEDVDEKIINFIQNFN